MNSLWMRLGCLSVTTLALGCGGAGTASPRSAATSGGEPVIVITDTEEWDALKHAGEAAYVTACGACHPGGEADLGPKLKGEMQSVALMTKQIREGSGRMRPIGPLQLPESEMRGLMVYMRTLDAVADVQGP